MSATSYSMGLRSILREGELQTEPCAVFDDEPLLYLFYGRPAYRVNSQVLSSAIDAYAPVCFIVRPGSVKAPRRIFPFDRGKQRSESRGIEEAYDRDGLQQEKPLSRLSGTKRYSGVSGRRTLPRLGSRLRIPSPAPDFLRRISGVGPWFRAYKITSRRYCKLLLC